MKRLTILATGVLMLAGYSGSQGSPLDERVSPSRLTLNQSVAALDEEATCLAQVDKFAGAVLLARGGKILLNRGLWYRRSWQSRPKCDRYQIPHRLYGQDVRAVASCS